ncbi:hypothetical protein A3F29_00625 [Candidatus Roizmanbacteria bacterium RIFCSPHIGHO2_12_FULL_33_9]|uniref:Uncharacterized protein n=1 Tax=Candidatus Roizmanbacteria bacterium RIFCSPHIGHO2_12_FULL_33_9 TaxID=1802045 RepID=A0A1F7HI90_9BACT|nr:MAG: hypothetical protein A3F29_00625 [Candidatus Roizmanbacteria bacterium RIFCSPHIGHO2_12_FULL_33_9]
MTPESLPKADFIPTMGDVGMLMSRSGIMLRSSHREPRNVFFGRVLSESFVDTKSLSIVYQDRHRARIKIYGPEDAKKPVIFFDELEPFHFLIDFSEYAQGSDDVSQMLIGIITSKSKYESPIVVITGENSVRPINQDELNRLFSAINPLSDRALRNFDKKFFRRIRRKDIFKRVKSRPNPILE